MKTLRLLIENKRQAAMLVFVEPEAMDYWMLAGETCELVAEKEDDEAHFEIHHTDEGVTVFPSQGCGIISVLQRGEVLKCGHQRPVS